MSTYNKVQPVFSGPGAHADAGSKMKPLEAVMNQEVVPGSGVNFYLDNHGKQLLVEHGAGTVMKSMDKDQVLELLAKEGFGDLHIFPEALEKMLSCYNSGSEFKLVLGERRDGSFSIEIAADLMTAHLTVTPAYGGTPVAAEQIFAKLEQEGICFGVAEETIRTAVAKGYARNKLIAEGTHPVQGNDTQFISLLPEANNFLQHAEDLENIDYRNFGTITTVKQGDPLMRRLPATDGEAGVNILGLPAPAAKGNDFGFSPLSSGAEVHPDDPDLLIAALPGQPFLLKDGVKIEPVITIKNVDLSTGNLDIEGSLSISGDVKPGMRVRAAADIVITGMVEAAHIEAGGSIEIKGAVIGQGQPRIGMDDLNPGAATVRAEGSITALFVENAVLSAADDIRIREFVMNSELNAGNSILVGESGSSKGRIINSRCRATTKIEAITIGSRTDVGTMLEVGADPKVQEKFTAAKQALHSKEREQLEATRALDYYRENPSRTAPEEIKAREKILRGIQTEIQELTGQLRRMKRRFLLSGRAEIKAERQIYSGVKIHIGEKSLLLETDLNGVTFRMGEQGITY